MATIAPTSLQGSGIRTVVETTMTASDTFTYLPGTGQLLIIRNVTGGTITPNIDGADGVATPFPGVGQVVLNAGYFSGSQAAGVTRVVMLDTASAFLQGTIAVTGCSGAVVILLNN